MTGPAFVHELQGAAAFAQVDVFDLVLSCYVCKKVTAVCRPMYFGCGHQLCRPCIVEGNGTISSPCPGCPTPPPPPRVTSEMGAPRSSVTNAGYVILDSRDTESKRGWHPVSWGGLEHRLGIEPGMLAGRLEDYGLAVRACVSVEQARLRWRRHHPEMEMPIH